MHSFKVRLFLMTNRLRCMTAMALAGWLIVTSPAAGVDRVPNGLPASDWSSIRAAYEAGRHAVSAVDGGWVARNPGQQWRTQFDGRGFVTTPDTGDWSWGLELSGYRVDGAEHATTTPACAGAAVGRVEYQWDETLIEWFINDSRGLEHGYTIQKHQDAKKSKGQHQNLRIDLAVRGNLRSRVNDEGRNVTFVNDSGAAVLNYSGLKVFDADGKSLSARFDATANGLALTVDDSAARYPLTVDPIAQQAYLKASNTDASDFFGISVAISGDTVVVGALAEDSTATGVNGNQANNFGADSGAAYVFVRSGGVWSQQAYLKASNTDPFDAFGYSVAISGDTVVVGAIQEDSSATGVNGNQADNGADGSGAAYVFVRNGTTWSQQAYLKASNTAAQDGFAYSLAISGDTVVIGAPLEDSNATGVNGNQANNSATESGAVYVFVRSGTAWSQQAYIKASNTDSGDNFGRSVAISDDTVLVGAWGESSSATGINGNQADNTASISGAAYVFVRSGTNWSQQAYLKASNTDFADEFGFSVSVSGDTAIVGAFQEDSNALGVNGNQADNSAPNSGAAYVFTRNGGAWSQQAYLKASNTETFDYFGYSVAVSGDLVVIGAYLEASNATGINGNQADNSASEAGATYAFRRSGNTWSQIAYLKASNAEAGDRFGYQVAASGETAVVGAFREDSNATGVNGSEANNSAPDSGAAYVFAGLGPPDTDGDGVPDSVDVCPNNEPGLPVACDGRPLRDCNGDCAVDGADVQCIVNELLGP